MRMIMSLSPPSSHPHRLSPTNSMATATQANSAMDSTSTNDDASSWTTLKSVTLVLTCTLAMIVNLASSASVSVFLPVIGRDLGVREDSLQWTVSAFSLSSGCFLVFFGRLADLYGRKKAFLLGTSFLGAMSIGCGFAQNAVTLYILRGLQGLGPAAFLPACDLSRSAAFATFSAGAPIGGAIGTQFGALLAQNTRYTWRDPFFLFAALSFLCVLGGYLTIDKDEKSSDRMDKRVDWIGAFLVTAALALVIFTLGQGPIASHGWATPYIISLLVIGVVLLGLFVLWEHFLEQRPARYRAPLMKITLWSRDFVGLTPILTAIRMLPMTVTGIICNIVIVLLIGRVDVAIIIGLGSLFTSIGALLFALIHPTASYWAFGFPSTIVAVFGGDFVFAAGTLFVAKVCHENEQSLAGGLFQTLTQLGTAFGLAVSTIVHSSVTKNHASTGLSNAENAPLQAYQAAQWTAFGMALFCTLLAVVFLRGIGPVGLPPTDPPVQGEAPIEDAQKAQP
ncbi:hypothetical protein D9758_003166 [Tetrapyrgos nigripes]|uniref:Major facilitator superfamily (MFS) profile domain-containing protein n=1 Tax=Tetrapyrgos nigripes TaxID=182062 RepID=A0A8H5GJ48_9AGAR|nr:hypothetical protein D9758_003166 [Tetrapyrgos nigripes]